MAGYDAFAGATDDDLRQMVGLSTLPDENALLADALAQARQLRDRGRSAAEGRTSKWGTILGGLGGLVDQGRGAWEERKAKEGMQANIGEAQDGRLASARFQANALRGLMGGGQPGANPSPLGSMGPGPMGMPGAPQGMPMGGPPGGSLAGMQPGGAPPPQISTLGAPDMLRREEDPNTFLGRVLPGWPGGGW